MILEKKIDALRLLADLDDYQDVLKEAVGFIDELCRRLEQAALRLAVEQGGVRV